MSIGSVLNILGDYSKLDAPCHPEVPRSYQRGEGSCVDQVRTHCTRDPSLRLKDGCARDDDNKGHFYD